MTNLTFRSLLSKGTDILQAAQIPNCTNEVLILLCMASELPKEKVITNYDTIVNDLAIKKFYTYLEKRKSNIPLAYIRGSQEFWSLDFVVNSSTLIPRPDSEILVTVALKYATSNVKQIIDLGTGSGCLLLSILSELKNVIGVGIDISSRAIKTAKQNATNLNLSERAKFINSDWTNFMDISFQPLKVNEKQILSDVKTIHSHELTDKLLKYNMFRQFDMLVSNPPYLNNHDMNNLQKELHHEPHQALDGGEDGLECYRQILAVAPTIIKKNGVAIIEIGINQSIPLTKMILEQKFKVIEILKDLNNIERVIVFTI
jgi:release factor glutamine methyltransferase